MSEYTAKRARTRGRLLAAGQEILPGAVRRGLEHALGPGPVSHRAGLSRQTWYRYWRADDSGFLDELARTSLASVHVLVEPLVERLRSAPDVAPVTLLRDVARAHFGVLTHRRVALVHLLVATLAIEDQLLEAEMGTRPTAAPSIARDHVVRLDRTLTECYRPVLERMGRRPRPPLDVPDVVRHVSALASGYALRHACDPRGRQREAFVEAAGAAVAVLTEPVRTPFEVV